jgi:hypothetical protein
MLILMKALQSFLLSRKRVLKRVSCFNVCHTYTFVYQLHTACCFEALILKRSRADVTYLIDIVLNLHKHARLFVLCISKR